MRNQNKKVIVIVTTKQTNENLIEANTRNQHQ